MTLCTDDGQTACSLNFSTQLDIGTTTCHVSSDGNGLSLSSLSYNLSFFLVQLSVQYVMFNLTQCKHLAQHFRDFYRCGTNQYRTTGIYHLFDFFDNRFILFTLCLVYTVVHIDTGNRTVSRNNHYIQFIDIPEFTCFCFGSTCHTRQLMVHTEIVLKSDSSECLSSGFYLHSFFRFYCLMQAIAPTTTIHDTSGLFVYNLNLSVHYHIVSILFEHGVSLKQLIDSMYTF